MLFRSGQYSIIVPDKNAVVTVTAHNEKNCGDIIRAVFRDVVEELWYKESIENS